jgi:GTP cyclohydrolase FolE2
MAELLLEIAHRAQNGDKTSTAVCPRTQQSSRSDKPMDIRQLQRQYQHQLNQFNRTVKLKHHCQRQLCQESNLNNNTVKFKLQL